MAFILVALTGVVMFETVAAQTQSPLDVLAFGAVADGTTDDTGAFQRALEAAGKNAGTVSVPAGRYHIAGSLTIPPCVTLRGTWAGPHSADADQGSVINATGGAGNEDGPPLFSLNRSSTVEGLTIFYPNQDVDSLRQYPWTIQGKGIHCNVIDITLVNSYKGVDFGTYPNQLHYIRNLYACVLKIGVFVDKTSDIGRIENVHLTPGVWGNAAYPNKPEGEKMERLVQWLHRNLIGFLIGRTDWEYMSNCFVIFPKIGYHFVETSGEPETGLPNAVLTQCGSDVCAISVQVDASQEHAGIAFSNGQFMAQAVIGPHNKGPVKFSNCGFWARGATVHQAVIEGSGTVTFTGCHFASWARNPGSDEAPCILVKGGSVVMTGCEFFPEGGQRHDLHALACGGRNQIELGENVRSAVIVGNLFRGGTRILNNAPSTASIRIDMNAE
jgi:hypothetical protein